MNRLCACLIAATLLSGCSANGTKVPSLERRPAERLRGEFQPPPPPPPAPPIDPATANKIDSLLAQARAADARFHEQLPRAQQTIGAAAGSRPGNEAWSLALVALAGLDAARSEGMVALADLDSLLITGRINGAPASEAQAARDSANALARAQSETIAALQARLGL